MKVLIVRSPFEGFQRGDRIADAEKVRAILATDHASFVVVADEPDEPAEETHA